MSTEGLRLLNEREQELLEAVGVGNALVSTEDCDGYRIARLQGTFELEHLSEMPW